MTNIKNKDNAEGESRYSVIKDVKKGKGTIIKDHVNLYCCEIGENCKIDAFVYIESGVKIGNNGTVEFFSEIAISSSFTTEGAENAEALENPSVDWNGLKLCALGDLRGDKSLGF